MTDSPAQAATHDWYLREWVAHAGKRQAALTKELGWDKARASFVWNGKQEYRRRDVAQISAWLEIEPFELLMPPTEALALRRLRETAHLIAAEDRGRDFSHEEILPPRRAKR